MSFAAASDFFAESSSVLRRRWGTSFVLIVALHLGLALAAAFWQRQADVPMAPQPALLIDMAPALPAEQPKPVRSQVSEPPKPQEPAKIEKAEVVLHRRKPKPQPPKPRVEERKMAPAPAQIVRPAAAAKPAGPTAAEISARQNYLSKLVGHLERYKRYPYAARRRHQEGTVHLRFAMDARGHLLSSRIERSSGFSSLDREVMEMVRRAEPLPVPPPDAPSEFVVPMNFVLK